jgi:hypothetical protein
MLVSKSPIFDPAGAVIMVGAVPIRIRADFTYNISPTVISIVDAGLDKCSVTEDIRRSCERSNIGTKAHTFRSATSGRIYKRTI